jgi:hypothetical protein
LAKPSPAKMIGHSTAEETNLGKKMGLSCTRATGNRLINMYPLDPIAKGHIEVSPHSISKIFLKLVSLKKFVIFVPI